MKENEINEIGKRLYELEADPPKDGWKNVYSGITSPRPSAFVVWSRKNWWKPLVLVFPAIGIFTFSEYGGQQAMSLASKTNRQVEITIAPTTSEEFKKSKSTDLNPKDVNLHLLEESTSISHSTLNAPVATREYSQSAKVKFNDSALQSSDQLSSNIVIADTGVTSTLQTDNNKPSHKSSAMDTTSTLNSTISEAGHHIIIAAKNNSFEVRDNVKVDTLMASNQLDTLLNASHSLQKKSEETSTEGAWRLIAAITLQSSGGKIQPIVNDEVFITNVEQTKKRYRNPNSLGVSIGTSRQFTKLLSVEVLLTYLQASEQISYTFTTGEVDTLITTEQSNNRYLVSPVYENNTLDATAKYTYGGIRLGATYYFLTNTRSRFSFFGAIGINSLLKASIKGALSNGDGVNFDEHGFAKTNYVYTIGAGYHLKVVQGWELMIGPTLLHQTKAITSHSLPYNLSQRSGGINFMISKTINK